MTKSTNCWYCGYESAQLTYCPLCRRTKVRDKSGQHKQTLQLLQRIPIFESELPQRVTVQINRGKGNLQTLHGRCVSETSTHWGLIIDNMNGGPTPHNDISVEYFPKESPRTNCHI